MVGLNDIINDFIFEMVNPATLDADLLISLSFIIDLFSVMIAFIILWWFFTIPYKIFKISRGRL